MYDTQPYTIPPGFLAFGVIVGIIQIISLWKLFEKAGDKAGKLLYQSIIFIFF